MQRTDYISQWVYMSIGQYTAGMRTFIGKGEIAIVVFCDADLFAIHFCDGNIVRTELQFIDMFGDLGH